MLIQNGQKFIKVDFDSEDEVERVVEDNYEQFFGSLAIYLSKKRINTSGGSGTIPDAYVIDIDAQQWYLVEVERGIHGTWNHIAPQVSKQIASISNPDTHARLLDHAISTIRGSERFSKVFDELDIDQIDIRKVVEDILRKPPKVAIPIDTIPSDLTEWAQTLKTQVIIWTIDKYVDSADRSTVVYRLPDELTPTMETNPETGRTVTVYELRGSELIVELVKRGHLGVGDSLSLSYKPRGGDQHDFRAEILEDGKLKVDTTVFDNCSYAAVYCYQKVGSERTTENGLRKWRVPSGQTLEELREKILADK